MDDETAQRIRRAAQVAFMDIWESAVIPTDAPSGDPETGGEAFEDRAEAAYRETVSEMCAELDIDEREYYLADPDAAELYEPECMADEPDDSLFDEVSEDIRAEQDRLMDEHARDEDDLGQGLGY